MKHITPTTPAASSMNRTALFGLATLLTLTLAACGNNARTTAATATLNPTDTAALPATEAAATEAAQRAFVYGGQDVSWTATPAAITALSLSSGTNAVSSQAWTAATSGWGPIEKNKSNAGSKAGDGKTLALNGKTYTTGLGTHSNSSVLYDLGGKCATFTSDIGVDDEVGSLGSVVFQVYADGTKLYDSGTMTGSSATKTVSVSVAGKRELKLVVTDAGDNNYYDHADWAGATLTGCSVDTTNGTPTTTPAPAPAPTPAPTVSGPLVITKGGTYTGNWQSNDPSVPVITIKTSEPVIIENSTLRGRGNLVAGFRNRVTLRNNK
ncbi:NPCBM/NEW2 domain-containing protein, partial [Deinococcus sonorensis]